LSDPHWLSGFRINERMVDDYRKGRVFLAGDAAHVHSPAGGQGMNTGMQDTYNLAWKLALVHTGKARPTLLDSYSQERGAIGHFVLRAAGQATRVATLRNPVAQFFRNNVAWLVGRLPAFRRAVVRQLAEMTIHYPKSPLNGESARSAWTSGGISPGDRLPDMRLLEPGTGKERRLLELLHGTVFNLLLLPADTNSSTLEALGDIAKRVEAAYSGVIRPHLIVPADTGTDTGGQVSSVWIDPEQSVRKILGAADTALALIRPDGYLGYRGQPAAWEGLREYLGQFLIAHDQKTIQPPWSA
jgi:hypothetical protein